MALAQTRPMFAKPRAPEVVPDPTIRPSGRVLKGSPATLQGLLDTAGPGDRIVGDPSSPWIGNWTINRRPDGARVILSSARDDVPLRFTTATSQPVFKASGRVGGLQWHNVEITLDPRVDYRGGQSLVELGNGSERSQLDTPRSLGFTNSRLFGNPGQDVRRGILTNCADFFFVDGRIEEIHQRGSDSQAICGWNAGAGHLVRNAWLEAASENIMYGGGPSNGAEVNPRDITIERVTLYKNPAWGRGTWNIKNHLEFKNAQRVKVRGLHCQNCWLDGQTGRSIVITPRDVKGRPWTVTQDIDIEHALLEDVVSAFVLLGWDDAAGPPSDQAQRTSRIRFRNWLTRISPGGKNFEISLDSADVEMDRMTFTGQNLFAVAIVDGTVTRLKNTRNIFAAGANPFIGARGEHNVIKHLFPDPVAWEKIVVVGPGAQAIPDPVNRFLPGAVATVANPANIFTAPATWPSGFQPTKGANFEGFGADVSAIQAAVLDAR